MGRNSKLTLKRDPWQMENEPPWFNIESVGCWQVGAGEGDRQA